MPIQPRTYPIPPMAPANPAPRRESWARNIIEMHAANLTPTDPDFTPDNPSWEDFHR